MEKQKIDPKIIAAYKRVGLAAMKTVYDPQISQQIVAMISEDPQSIADAVLMVLDQLGGKMQGIPQSFVYSVGPAVIAFIIELGEAAGKFKASPELQKAVAAIAVPMMQEKMQGQGQQAPPPQAPPQAPPPQRGLIGQPQMGA